MVVGSLAPIQGTGITSRLHSDRRNRSVLQSYRFSKHFTINPAPGSRRRQVKRNVRH